MPTTSTAPQIQRTIRQDALSVTLTNGPPRDAYSAGAAKPIVAAAVVKEAKPAKKKGGMSAAGRAAIVAAQKARWAKIKGEAPTVPVKAKPATAKKKKTMSPEARAKIAAAAKKRWAERKAGK